MKSIALQNNLKIPETELLELLRVNDRKGFEYLYDNYSAALYGVIKRNIADDEIAADILQEVFVRIFRYINTYDANKGRLFTWMMNITRNFCVDYLRTKGHKQAQQTQDIEQSEASINARYQAETFTDRIGLKKILDLLPEPQFEVLDLVYMRGFSQQEASQMLNLPLGTVKTRIRTALGVLRKYFNYE